MQVAVFHPGTQHSWQTALALQELDRLAFYATSIFYQPERWPYRLERVLPARLAAPLGERFRRFARPGLDPALLRTAGMAEWIERLLAIGGLERLARRMDAFGNRRFGAMMGRWLASAEPFALWGYNGSSLEAFRAARAAGRACILDRTIGDWRTYNAAMAVVAEHYPEWFMPSERAASSSHIAHDEAEFALADRIVCGSPTAAASVAEWNGPEVAAKLRVLPYCYDELLFGGQPEPAPVPREGPVKFLFVGLAIPRKGIHHVLEAIAALAPKAAELTIVGKLGVPRAAFAPYAERVRHIPTVARSAIPQLMAEHHVLVFPSYFEGSALSLLEALASGMAIIQTRAAGLGGTERTGIVLDAPDTPALIEAMERAVADRDQLVAWRRAARDEARSYSFARYRDGIAALLAADGL